MARVPLVDANIFLRHIRQDHPDFPPRSTAYITRIRRGEIVARAHELIIFEAVYTLQSFYKMPTPEIAQAMPPLIAMPALKFANKARLRRVFDWYVRYNLSFDDAYPAVLARDQKL